MHPHMHVHHWSSLKTNPFPLMDSLVLNGSILHCLLWVTHCVFESRWDLRSMALYGYTSCAVVISLHVCQYNFSFIDKMHDQGTYKETKRHYSMFTFFENEIITFLSFPIHRKCKWLSLLDQANVLKRYWNKAISSHCKIILSLPEAQMR